MRPMLGLLINGLYVEQIVISDGAEKVVSAHSMYSKYLRQEQFLCSFNYHLCRLVCILFLQGNANLHKYMYCMSGIVVELTSYMQLVPTEIRNLTI